MDVLADISHADESASAERPMLEACDLRGGHGGFQRVPAVQGVSFRVWPGEWLGIVGPRGAGKSAIIALVAGVRAPDAGWVRLDGRDTWRGGEPVRRRIGWVPQVARAALRDAWTIDEHLERLADRYRLPSYVYRRSRADLLGLARLEPWLDERVCSLTAPMQRRVAVVCALFHRPDVLLLDEPTTGLDEDARLDLWQLIELAVDVLGATVVLAATDTDELPFCDRLAVVDRGVIVDRRGPRGRRVQLPCG